MLMRCLVRTTSTKSSRAVAATTDDRYVHAVFYLSFIILFGVASRQSRRGNHAYRRNMFGCSVGTLLVGRGRGLRWEGSNCLPRVWKVQKMLNDEGAA